MLRRRDSASADPGDVPPRPTSASSFGGSPSLSLVINQRPFRASTAETQETESSQSEIPTIPPRPPPPSRPLPSIYTSPLEEQSPPPSRLPDTVPISTPQFSQFPQLPQIPVHPSTPTQPIQPSDDFVGGFRVGSPFQHEPNRDHRNTADHTHLSDQTPSFPLNSGPPHSKSVNVTGGIHTKVWPTYNKISQDFDEKLLKKCNSDLDVLLIFAALFSAIVTTFLIRALDDLGPDYQQQSALLLHQLLNGRDPSLANISDPTLPFNPSGFAIAVNCLWFASLSASLGASFGAMICKEWFTEYDGAKPVVELIRACQRQVRFMAFRQWNVYTFVALLPPLLHSSVLMFFTGAVIYLWQMDERVAIVYLVAGGLFAISYFLSTFLPFVIDAPFRLYSTLLFHRLSVAIGWVVMPIVDIFVHACYLTVQYVASAILWLIAKMTVDHRALQDWYMGTRSILPGEYKHIRVWWAKRFEDSLEKIDTSPKVQEEAVLWLSGMPLSTSESKPVVSSLAFIASSRTRRFPKSVTMFLNLTLESLFDEEPSQEATNALSDKEPSQEVTKTLFDEEPSREVTNASIDCVLVLGHIKFQSTVDRNLDCDHNVGGLSVAPFVAWRAQQLTVDAFREKINTPQSEAIRARLLTAAAWLSPMDGYEEAEWKGGTKLKIQDRWQFIEKIKMMLERPVRGKPLDNKVLISLIRGMHACIPRGDHGITSFTVSFLPTLCRDYESPWSEDEDVLRALITYALDLLLPPARRKPLVEREIEFDELALELIDELMINTTYVDVVALGFWLIYRVPYAFKSRKTLLTDIAHIWTLTNSAIPEDRREWMNFYAVDAFVAVAQFHVAAKRDLPKFTSHTALGLLEAALGYDCSRLMATYAIAMILNLDESSQVDTFAGGIKAEPFRNTLFDVRGDIEKNAPEDDIVNLHIYSALILLKLPPIELDVGKVKGLIRKMETAIEGTVIRDSGVAGNPEAEESADDLDRVKWKAIYLSALLFKFVPEGEKEERMEGFQTRVRGLLRSRGLPLVGDYERCLEPLAMGALESSTPAERQGPTSPAEEQGPTSPIEQQGPTLPAEEQEPTSPAKQQGPASPAEQQVSTSPAFEAWIDPGFPLFPLAGSAASAKTE